MEGGGAGRCGWGVGEEVEVEREGIFFAASVADIPGGEGLVVCRARRPPSGMEERSCAHWWVPLESPRLFHPASSRGIAPPRKGGAPWGEDSPSGIKIRLAPSEESPAPTGFKIRFGGLGGREGEDSPSGIKLRLKPPGGAGTPGRDSGHLPALEAT